MISRSINLITSSPPLWVWIQSGTKFYMRESLEVTEGRRFHPGVHMRSDSSLKITLVVGTMLNPQIKKYEWN